jgi:hypothetical protein
MKIFKKLHLSLEYGHKQIELNKKKTRKRTSVCRFIYCIQIRNETKKIFFINGMNGVSVSIFQIKSMYT